jgi:L-iditol 2-dehydrogenase/galactitol-1-phosphate 5-dehydrogenase
MKALILRARGLLEYNEMALPDRGHDRGHDRDHDRDQAGALGDVLVRVAYAGICGSDIPRAFHGKAYHYPLVMGHEFSGTVVQAAADSGYTIDDRVVVFPLLPCRRCAACGTGDYAQCQHYDYYGSRRDGGFAEFVRVPASNLFRVPDRVSLRSAAMTEPCAVALHGVNKLDVKPGMSALVIGGGPIGNMVAQWLRLRGCGQVYVSDIDARKRAIAADMGFSVIDSSGGGAGGDAGVGAGGDAGGSAGRAGNAGDGAGGGAGNTGDGAGNREAFDLAAELRHLTDTDGVDCVVEACGLPATFLQAVQCAGRFGQIVFMGNIHGTFQVPAVDFSRILRHEIRISGTWNSRIEPRGKDEWTTVLGYLDAGIQVAPLISHDVPLDAGPTIFARIADRGEWFNKVLFDVGGSR